VSCFSLSCGVRLLDIPFARSLQAYDADSARTPPLTIECTRTICRPSPPSLVSPPRNPTPTSVSTPGRVRHRPYRSLTMGVCACAVRQAEVTPGIPASEYERRRKQLVDGLPDGSLVVCVAGQVKYMSAGEHSHVSLGPSFEWLAHRCVKPVYSYLVSRRGLYSHFCQYRVSLITRSTNPLSALEATSSAKPRTFGTSRASRSPMRRSYSVS